MTMTDPVADMLARIKNALLIRKDFILTPSSKFKKAIADVMKREGFIKDYEVIDDGKSGMYKIKLMGRINNCGVIKPRFSVKKDEYEKFEKRYLPAQNIGFLIISTPFGVMTEREAIKRGVGGRAIAFVY